MSRQQHIYNKERDKAQSEDHDPEIAVIQVDFSENYTCVWQDEIQSAHWNQSQVTLFTVATWHTGEIHSSCFVSDNLTHSKETLVAYIDRALEDLPSSVKIVSLWSDGPRSQFKNKYVAAAMNDLIIAASNMTLLNRFKETMQEQFKMKDLGKISYFLGIDFTQKDDEIRISQRRYITKMLERFDMSDCKPRATPCEAKLDDNPYNNEYVDPKKYREIVGSLIYAATSTRPDIAWVVSQLSQHLSNPRNKHMTMAKHVLRFLKGTIEHKLVYRKTNNPLELIAFSDSDWASSIEDRKSTTGYCFALTKGGAVISWKSKKQPTVALSTCEAEYMGLGTTTQESLYLTQLLKGMDDKV